jgi:hypothetical protein
VRAVKQADVGGAEQAAGEAETGGGDRLEAGLLEHTRREAVVTTGHHEDLRGRH